MVLIDSSAWVEFLRNTGSDVCERVDELLGGRFAVCDPVRLEVLAGARDDRHAQRLEALLARGRLIATVNDDWVLAAGLYRACRENGVTIRKLYDCLIAAIAIREELPLLQIDADFVHMAKHTPLELDE